MTNTEATDLCSVFGINTAPVAMVNRKLFNGETSVALRKNALAYPNWATTSWGTRSLSQSTTGAIVDVNVYGSYNPVSRVLNATVDASFVDYVLNGDLRVSLMLVEDSIVGANNPGFNQVNYYDTRTGHPYVGLGDPIVGYTHRRVLRDILPSTWGDSTVIPASISLNTNYTGNYSIAIPASYNISQLYIIGTVNYFGGPNLEEYEVLNAQRIKLNLITSSEEIESEIIEFNFYPNPTRLDFTNVEFKLRDRSSVEATVYDLTGKRVSFQDFGIISEGNQRIHLKTSTLGNGIYFVTFRMGNQLLTEKFLVNR